MHELSIAVAICEEVAERAARENITGVKSVRLRVGELCAVVNEALLFAWDVAAEGTAAAGSVLQIETVPVRVFCPVCQGERPALRVNHLACSDCGTPTPTISRGRELELVAMEVYDAVETR
ncbi:MAG: hydrogenase maturation nickel metallochaperone HypA/HybF [Vulcanimicrobiaceae bacterium]